MTLSKEEILAISRKAKYQINLDEYNQAFDAIPSNSITLGKNTEENHLDEVFMNFLEAGNHLDPSYLIM